MHQMCGKYNRKSLLQQKPDVAATLADAGARAQQAAVAFLRRINQEIGELLGVDFAALAKRPGCC